MLAASGCPNQNSPGNSYRVAMLEFYTCGTAEAALPCSVLHEMIPVRSARVNV